MIQKLIVVVGLLLCCACIVNVEGASSFNVYVDAVATPTFSDWSWATTRNAADPTEAHSGSYSYSFVPASYQAVYFEATGGIYTSNYSGLTFWAYRTTSGTQNVEFAIVTYSTATASSTVVGSGLIATYTGNSWPANTWVQGTVSFSSFTGITRFDGFWFQDTSGAASGSNPEMYLDDITLVGTSTGTTAPTKAPTAAPTNGATGAPTKAPTVAPTPPATAAPTTKPGSTAAPTKAPTAAPTTVAPTNAGTKAATSAPTTVAPTKAPTSAPTKAGTAAPTTSAAGDPAVTTFYNNVQSGPATYYGAYTSGGECMLDPTPPAGNSSSIKNTVAIVTADYLLSKTCGMCISVTGSGVGSGANPVTGTFTVFVNNECPSCNAGGLDLGLNGDGLWDITWQAVPCPVSSNVQYVIKTGSSATWFAIQPRNTKYPVYLTDILVGGSWVNLPRVSYNYFVQSFSGSGVTFPATIRLTSVMGQVVEDTIPSLQINVVFNGNVQFT